MKLSVVTSLAAFSLVPSVSAINFWVAEALSGDGCVGSGGVPCGSSNDLAYITQDGKKPGCVQLEQARLAGGWPPANFFSSTACGVKLNFYKDSNGRDYTYYKKDGDGKQLGRCVPNSPGSAFCLNVLALGSTVVNGRYACTNYNQVVDGTNPCQS
ncbi:hypothetical protein NM208_g3890 [Fusarium decemcellulare]|uniref:Uncharacterized protein n=1 Tax=Fusarium decemcellulare TaxID=57161 RepID=A0ACC1SMP7_9HYPO|nr:hypothetical protein NM208_g3890 [Fusarium decemcellulare]